MVCLSKEGESKEKRDGERECMCMCANDVLRTVCKGSMTMPAQIRRVGDRVLDWDEDGIGHIDSRIRSR